MKFWNYLLIAAAVLPGISQAQSTIPKAASFSSMDANKDQIVTKEEAKKAGMPDAVFKKIDKDGNNQITSAESNAYRTQNNSIDAIDSDKDKKISKAEAVKRGMTEQEFRILDQDNSGYITQNEWDTGDWIIW